MRRQTKRDKEGCEWLFARMKELDVDLVDCFKILTKLGLRLYLVPMKGKKK
jgi:hypothetical protein